MLSRLLIYINIILFLLFTSGCGFQPLYAKRVNQSGVIATTDELLAGVHVETIKNREGHILYNLLLDRLNTGNHKRPETHKLTTWLKISKSSLGVQSDDTTNRRKLTVTANFTLQSTQNSHSFTIRQVSGYSETESEYPTLIAEQDAIQRNLREIANDAKIRIALLLEQER